MIVVAGIDVSKATLDVSVSEGPVRRFENSRRGIRSLLKHIDRMGVTRAVCESTGGYERLLVSRLKATVIGAQVAHPLRVRAFARACGYEAKTDPLDAQVLSRYGVVFPEPDTHEQEGDEEREELRQLLRLLTLFVCAPSLAHAATRPRQILLMHRYCLATAWCSPSRTPMNRREMKNASSQLRQLLSRRRQLVEQRVQDRSRLDKGISASVGKSTRRHISWLDKEIERLDKEYIELLKRSDNLCRQADLYRSVPGVGQLTAATLVAYLPELGQRDGKALTSLVGLAPWSRDSGKKRGNRSIRGGRSTVRAVLYMAAMSVIRVEGVNKRFYQGLRKRGKVGKVALVAVMRKMLLHLNAVARRGTPWVKQEAWQSTTFRTS